MKISYENQSLEFIRCVLTKHLNIIPINVIRKKYDPVPESLAYSFIEKETLAQCEFCKIFENTLLQNTFGSCFKWELPHNFICHFNRIWDVASANLKYCLDIFRAVLIVYTTNVYVKT